MTVWTLVFFLVSFLSTSWPFSFFVSVLWASWWDLAVGFNEAGTKQICSSSDIADVCTQRRALAFRSHSFSALCICVFLYSFNTSWRMHYEHQGCESLRLPVLTAPWLQPDEARLWAESGLASPSRVLWCRWRCGSKTRLQCLGSVGSSSKALQLPLCVLSALPLHVIGHFHER